MPPDTHQLPCSIGEMDRWGRGFSPGFAELKLPSSNNDQGAASDAIPVVSAMYRNIVWPHQSILFDDDACDSTCEGDRHGEMLSKAIQTHADTGHFDAIPPAHMPLTDQDHLLLPAHATVAHLVQEPTFISEDFIDTLVAQSCRSCLDLLATEATVCLDPNMAVYRGSTSESNNEIPVSCAQPCP
jgi:hypothetical protein